MAMLKSKIGFPLPVLTSNDDSEKHSLGYSQYMVYDADIKHSDSFKETISAFIHYIESSKSHRYSISKLCSQFNFKRRRFYDVIIVLEAIGVCQHVNVDTIAWFSLRNITNTMKKLVHDSNANNPYTSLKSILPSERSVSIGKLTTLFMLCFSALNRDTLDIRQVACFFSRENGRFKTTLCKLYQITHILCAVGVLEKHHMPCFTTIKREYFVESLTDNTKNTHSLSIESLLTGNEERSLIIPRIDHRIFEFLNSRVQPVYFTAPAYVWAVPVMSAV